MIATTLQTTVRSSASIDWNLKDSVRAAMRANIRRVLAILNYPPDYEERAIELILEQAERFAISEVGAWLQPRSLAVGRNFS